MQPNQNLHPFDPGRWLLGLQPPWFLIEVLGRTVLIYLALQVVLRLMGRRVASQMTAAELGVIVTIAAAIGVPMQVPDRGLLPAFIILLLALIFQRLQGIWHFRSEQAEKISTGEVVTVIQDGRILIDSLRRMVLSRERVFAVLREKGIEHLGEVQRGYVEVTGDFSLYKFRKPVAGLSILPMYDDKMRSNLRVSQELFTCGHCGAIEATKQKPTWECVHCDHNEWVKPIAKVDSREDP